MRQMYHGDLVPDILDSEIHPRASISRGARVRHSRLSENVSLGHFARVDHSSLEAYVRVDRMNHLAHVCLGRHSYSGANTVIMHSKIGAFSSISWGVTIGGGEHDHSRVSQHCFLYNAYDEICPPGICPTYDRFREKCIVGSDVWVAANATILRGVNIGDGAVIGANAVVTKDVPPYAVVGGVPAETIKYRFGSEIISALLDIKWWRWPEDRLRKNFSLLSGVPDVETLAELKREAQEIEALIIG